MPASAVAQEKSDLLSILRNRERHATDQGAEVIGTSSSTHQRK